MPVLGHRADCDLAFVGEFDRIANQVKQDLRQPPRIAMPGRQPRRDIGAEFEPLRIGQALGGADHRLHDIGQSIIFEREHKLPGLDLR